MNAVAGMSSCRSGGLPALCLAALFSLPGLGGTSAQTTDAVTNDFTHLPSAGLIVVVDSTGQQTQGQLLRFSPDQLTMAVGERTLVFDRQQVSTIHAVGDSLKNGMLIGLFTGIAVGFAAGIAAAECTGYGGVSRPCDDGEKLILAHVGGVLAGGAGLGIGTAVDALRRGRRLIYRKVERPGHPAVSITPALAPSGSKLLLTLTW
jgi:hypothetical protein